MSFKKLFNCSFATLFSISLLSSITCFAQEQITLNFNNAEISTVINTVSELSGKTFIIDPRVKGKVNVVSKQPLSKEAVYETFLSILQVHGYTTVAVGKVTKIIPDAGSKFQPQKVITRKDLSDNDEMVTHVISLKYVRAQNLVPILRPMVNKNGHLAAYIDSNALIVSDRASNVQRLLAIIARVDKNSEQEIEIIPLQHAMATEVARLLDKLHPKNPKAPQNIRFAVDERTNSILVSGAGGKRLEIRTLISHIDTPVSQDGNTQVIYLRYANAENIAKILSGYSQNLTSVKKPGKGATRNAKNIVIQADTDSNALVITAPSGHFKSLRSVIQQLDAPRAQIHIEAIIAEVDFSTNTELGVEWVAGNSDGSQPLAITNLGNGLVGTLASAVAGATPTIGNGLNLAVGKINKGSTSYGALLRALVSDSSANILSTPSLMTLDNQEASIVIGKNVPFVTGEYTPSTGTSTANPFRTISRQDVGLTLKVKPQINEGDAITLEIEQDITSVNDQATAGSVDTVTNKRSIKTSVLVPDGEMIVIGGLIDEVSTNVQNKVPLLGDIPLLGRLFRYESIKKAKTNLMVFIRPTIVHDGTVSRRISSNKYSFIQEQLAREEPEAANPQLPDLPSDSKVDKNSSSTNNEKQINHAEVEEQNLWPDEEFN